MGREREAERERQAAELTEVLERGDAPCRGALDKGVVNCGIPEANASSSVNTKD